uniref:Uncharacterized protein n=1 Tax=Tanacetum cinerariifolium TaxID=118510 RepID=A0A699HPT1_TANCI|nr:hypothetical protein [Tanacetum cinerariifolium]
MNRKVPFRQRECSKCGQMFHNKHACDEKRFPDEEYQALLKEKKDGGEVEVNESDEDEEDVELMMLMKMTKRKSMMKMRTTINKML